jgi:hypothetical protein
VVSVTVEPACHSDKQQDPQQGYSSEMEQGFFDCGFHKQRNKPSKIRILDFYQTKKVKTPGPYFLCV